METLEEIIRGRRQEGATPPYLPDIELGRRYPSDELLARLGVALETPIEELKAADTRPPVDHFRRLPAANEDAPRFTAFQDGPEFGSKTGLSH